MSGTESAVTVEARAKINLTLEILGERPDGYHELRSIVMPVTLADTLTLERGGAGIELDVTPAPGIDLSAIGPAENNLAARAVRLLMRRFGGGESVRIHIFKRIPIGAGLGGGSADAAGALRGLNRLWGLGLATEALEALGAELGSDVPALVHGGAVVMEGRGERVRSLFGAGARPPGEGLWVVIANPGITCLTSEIYRRWRGPLTDGPGILHNMFLFLWACQAEAVAGALYNGLQQTVFERYPEAAGTASLLKKAGCLGVLLSGSGAAVFGIVRDEAHGKEVCQKLDSGIWHVLARTCPVV